MIDHWGPQAWERRFTNCSVLPWTESWISLLGLEVLLISRCLLASLVLDLSASAWSARNCLWSHLSSASGYVPRECASFSTHSSSHSGQLLGHSGIGSALPLTSAHMHALPSEARCPHPPSWSSGIHSYRFLDDGRSAHLWSASRSAELSCQRRTFRGRPCQKPGRTHGLPATAPIGKAWLWLG